MEPVFGILVVLAAAGVEPLMPWLLSFAAGAMLYVVVEELVPQAHSRRAPADLCWVSGDDGAGMWRWDKANGESGGRLHAAPAFP